MEYTFNEEEEEELLYNFVLQVECQYPNHSTNVDSTGKTQLEMALTHAFLSQHCDS